MDRRAPQAAHPQAAAPAATLSSRAWGHNYRLSRADLRRALLQHVTERADHQGKRLPCDGDMVDFMERSQIVLLDADGREVDVERVVVAWEDR